MTCLKSQGAGILTPSRSVSLVPLLTAISLHSQTVKNKEQSWGCSLQGLEKEESRPGALGRL